MFYREFYDAVHNEPLVMFFTGEDDGRALELAEIGGLSLEECHRRFGWVGATRFDNKARSWFCWGLQAGVTELRGLGRSAPIAEVIEQATVYLVAERMERGGSL